MHRTFSTAARESSCIGLLSRHNNTLLLSLGYCISWVDGQEAGVMATSSMSKLRYMQDPDGWGYHAKYAIWLMWIWFEWWGGTGSFEASQSTEDRVLLRYWRLESD